MLVPLMICRTSLPAKPIGVVRQRVAQLMTRPQLTWMVSGLHRISGTVMGSAIAVLAGGLMVMPFDFAQLIQFIKDLGLPRPLIYIVKWFIAWPIVFHFLNGIRFLGFDYALWITMPQIYKTGWFVVGLSILIATALAVYEPKALRQVKK